MNWSAIDFDWNQVRAFLATIEEGTLSAAARALGQTQPTLGRQVTALEEELGVTLFERSGRQLIPTPAALEMAEHVRAMGEAATRLSLVASGQSTSIEGLVKITATEMYSAFVLPDLIADMTERHPGLVIEIIATNSLSDLRRREADIAIRNAEPTDPDLIVRKIRDDSGGMTATRDFVARHGPFESLDDLAGVPFLGFGSATEILPPLQARGVPITEKDIVARSESHLVHLAMVRRGLGIGLNAWAVCDLLPDLVPVLREELSFEFPIYLVAPQELRTNRRVRIVYDALVAHLKALDKSKPRAKSA